ncbi:Acyltransferase family protein [Hyphomicrobiales bacterium]|nr:Acyltransferase family protein [Hyphomicrobiales bacterium]CAH1698481.1 Acyltransferase family protein [Hyphomicrobiales bacterium]CAI0342130.1 Acyltransferase family protein [Hyphomicrobiales bacterium]
MAETTTTAQHQPTRIGWVDTGKGICIVLVVLMHVAGGLEDTAGQESWIDPLIAWAKQFRMPGLFLLSGLFVPRLAGLGWGAFLDRKIVPLAYFYLLWFSINALMRFPPWGEAGLSGFARSYTLGLVDPFGVLWFIYLLAIFFVVAKAVWRWRHAALLASALLALAPLSTGWMVPDQFTAYFVFFLAGAVFSAEIRAGTDRVAASPGKALLLWGGWFGLSTLATPFLGHDVQTAPPGVHLLLGAAGVSGILLSSVLLVGRLRWLDYCGRNSLPIYLAFFLPMVIGRIALLRSGIPLDPGLAALLLTAISVAVPLLLHRLVRGTPLAFLFMRPNWLGARRDGAQRQELGSSL